MGIYMKGTGDSLMHRFPLMRVIPHSRRGGRDGLESVTKEGKNHVPEVSVTFPLLAGLPLTTHFQPRSAREPSG